MYVPIEAYEYVCYSCTAEVGIIIHTDFDDDGKLICRHCDKKYSTQTLVVETRSFADKRLSKIIINKLARSAQ